MNELLRAKPSVSDMWIERASRGDALLKALMLALDAEHQVIIDTGMGRDDEKKQLHMASLQEMIIDRQQELNIDPLEGPYIPHDSIQ